MRNEAFADDRSKTRMWLSNLLARIHRDGGHHESAVGTEQAALDAEAVVIADRQKLETLKTTLCPACDPEQKPLLAYCETHQKARARRFSH